MMMGAEMGDWNTVKKEAASPDFKAAVDAFASTDVPEEFATDARKQAKDDAAKKFQSLVKQEVAAARLRKRTRLHKKVWRLFERLIPSLSRIV
jgi:hypothetical protein